MCGEVVVGDELVVEVVSVEGSGDIKKTSQKIRKKSAFGLDTPSLCGIFGILSLIYTFTRGV